MLSPLVIMDSTCSGHKTICLPFPSEVEYWKLITKGNAFQNHLAEIIAQHSELLPSEITNGYWLHGSVYTQKLDITTRRIKLVTNQAVYRIRPDCPASN